MDSLTEIREQIDHLFCRLQVRVNAELVLLYWRVGHCLNQALGQDAEEESCLQQVAEVLMLDYGKVWNVRQLSFCLKAARVFGEDEIRNALASQVSWSHMRHLMRIEDGSKRQFYAQMCGRNGWSVPQLVERVDSMLYERSISSRRPEELPDPAELDRGRRATPDLLVQDPLLMFLGVQSLSPQEHLESALCRELELYLLGLPGMALVARDRPLPMGLGSMDLLFFHRRLQRLVVIIPGFAASAEAVEEDRLELILHWLDENERQAGEGQSLGCLLQGGKLRCFELDPAGLRPASLDLGPVESFLVEARRRLSLRLGL